MILSQRVNNDFIFNVGCNILCTAKYSLINPESPVVILSNGYGTRTFDRPIALSLIRQLEGLGFNWVHYRYPEREPNPVSQSLYLSSGLSTLRAIHSWLVQHSFFKIGLFGISFGANISIELALLERVQFLILVNPVIDYVAFRTKQLGGKNIEDWRKKNRIIFHYEDGETSCYYRFFEEALNQQLSDRMSKLNTRILVFQSELDQFIDWDVSQATIEKIPNSQFLLVPDAKHSFTESSSIKFFEEKISSATYSPVVNP